ncbi:hypothetical protein QK360_00380 [Pseudomonas aeruginosa]|nr:hypothetical protein [Pseudomonas aeruginosa]MDI3744140.1 hypothetical protein [Pseudomonas aeruginosa]
MDIEKITKLFGRSAADPAVEAMFQSLGIKRRPELARPAKSPYEAILRVNAQGMLFSFSERNYWEGLQVTSHGKSDTLIFTNVAVTSGIPDVMRRYVGSELPFGLQWEDDRVKAREKLAAAGWSNRLHAYKRDAWWLPDYHIRLTYQPGSIDQPEEPGIFDISLGIPMPASAEPFPPRYYPMPDQVYDLFGESPASPTFQSLFRDFDPIRLMTEAELEIVDRKHEYGFALYFDKTRRTPDGRPSFAGINMCRDRLGTSTAWRGPLPFGLGFDDSPSVFEQHLGKKANHWDENKTFGVARWFFPNLLIWINFDNLDNCIESVRILRAGYRDDLRD